MAKKYTKILPPLLSSLPPVRCSPQTKLILDSATLTFSKNIHTCTLSGGSSEPELPACNSAGPLQWERGPQRRPGGWVQGVGEGAWGVRGQDGGSEAWPRAADGAAAAAGGGAGGAAGETLPAEEQLPEPGGSKQRAGGQVLPDTMSVSSKKITIKSLFLLFCSTFFSFKPHIYTRSE